MQDRRLIGYSIAASALAAGSAGAEIQNVETFIIEGTETSTPDMFVLSGTIDLTGNGTDNFSIFGLFDYANDRGYASLSPISGNYVAREPFGGGYVVSAFSPGDTIDGDLSFGGFTTLFERDYFNLDDDYEPFLNQRGFAGLRLSGDTGNSLFACLDFQVIVRGGGFSAEIRSGLINTESGEAVTCPDFADAILIDRFEEAD